MPLNEPGSVNAGQEARESARESLIGQSLR